MPSAHSLCACPGGMPSLSVDRLAHRAHRPVAHHGQRRADIHPRHESVRRRARAIDALVGQPKPLTERALPSTSEIGALTGVPGHICTRPVAISCDADPLVELADGEDEPAVLVQERGRPGQLERRILTPQQPAQACAAEDRPARSATERRLAPMGSSRYSTFSSLTGAAMGISRRIELRESWRECPCARVTTPADAGGDVVGALVAEHLQRHSRRNLALKRGIVGMRGPARASAWSGSRPSPARSRRRQYPPPSSARSITAAALSGAVAQPQWLRHSCGIVQGFGDHHLAHCVGGAVLGQPRAAQAGA